MAQITWRNVDAPNFSGVGDSIRTFGNMIGNATGGLSDALGNFQNAARQDAGNAVMMNAMQYQDPTEYRNALASGSLFNGVDPTLVSQRTLENLDNRAGTLLNQEAQAGTNDYNAYRFGRLQDTNAALDAASPAIRQLSEAYQTGDPKVINAALSSTRDALSALPADQQLEMLGRLQGQGGQALNQQRTRFDTGVAMRNDADTQAAIGVMSQITRGAENPNDARLLAEAYSKQLSPTAQARLQTMLAQSYPGVYGNGVGASAPGTAGTKQGSPYDTTYGFTPTATPITQMSVGEVVQHQDGMKTNLGASPVGAYQINQATLKDFAPKVLGSDWQNQPMSAENQEKLGKAIFEARKNGNLKDTWAALPNAAPGAYKDMTWEQVKPIIAQAEVGADPLALIQSAQGNQAVSTLASGMIGSRSMQDNRGSLNTDFLGSLNDNSPVTDVADKLLEGDFKGADKRWVVARLNDISQRGNMSPALAAAVMRRAATNVPEGYISRAVDALNPFITNEAGNGLRLNDRQVDQLIEGVNRGEPLEGSVRNLGRVQAAQNIQGAQTAYDNAVAALNNTQNKIATGQTGLVALLPSRQEAVKKAAAMLQAAQGQVQADPANLAPRGFQSQSSVDRARANEDEARARRYRQLAEGTPAYMQPR